MAMEFHAQSQDQLQRLVLHDADLTTLYELQIYLDRRRSEVFEELNFEKAPAPRSTLKKNLSWTENILDICKKRQDDVRESNNAFNWRFRLEAQRSLPADLYNKIAESAKRS